MRLWLVKLAGWNDPVEVEAEYRAAARHYARSCVDGPPQHNVKWYKAVEWCRLKREQTT